MAKDIQSIGAIPAHLALLRSRPAWLGVVKNGLLIESGEAKIFADRLPTVAQRETLVARAEAIENLLSPCFDNDARKAVAMLIATLPSQGAEGATMAIRGDAFRMVLEDQPGWAVRLACRSFLFGDRKAKFCPSPSDVRDAAMAETAAFRQEHYEIQAILVAKPIDPPVRLPKPDGLRWTDIKRDERVGFTPEEWRSPVSDVMLKDLERRAEKRAKSGLAA